ncbi:hypothetical protein QAD02_013813 [Eretmocerus hayati]|uniref:Uncharacterized protein n=1 Tax=Eretmocerus hayati TaxID=131215 RepID=A0ACC2P5A9_9HYME|nr:hypothetical protein QAD02_013813 [Eretmocerus hayati]
MEGLPELSDWELEIGLSMGDDDETSLDRFVTAIAGQNDGSQAMGMNTAEGTGPSHDMGQLDCLLEGLSSQNPVETGNQEAVTSSSSGNPSEPTRRDFCTPLDIGGLQIQGGEATMPAESTTGGPVVIELNSPEPTPGTSQETCRPRGRMSMVKRLNACLKKGKSVDPLPLTKDQMRHLRDKLKRIPACQDMLRIIDTESMEYFVKSVELQDFQHAGPGDLNLVHRQNHGQNIEEERQRVIEVHDPQRIGLRKPLQQHFPMLSHADLFTSLFFNINMLSTLGLQCSEILARGDAIINARNSLMTAERAEYSARAEAILLANTQALQDELLFKDRFICVSSFKLAPKLSWEGNMELHTVDDKEIKSMQISIHHLQALVTGA